MIFKLDNIPDLAMARWAAAEGFSYITFNFERDSNYFIEPARAAEICSWVLGPEIVARFSLDELAHIHDIYQVVKFDVMEMDLGTFQKRIGFEELPVILRVGKETIEAALKLQSQNPKIIALAVENSEIVLDKKELEKCIISESADISKYGHLPMGVSINSGKQNEPDFDFFDFFEKTRYTWSKTVV